MTTRSGQQFSLAEARVNRGFSIRSLAAELDMSYATLLRLERGEAIHPSRAKRVADFFEVQVTDLMPADRAAA